jgi:hypothetical protein
MPVHRPTCLPLRYPRFLLRHIEELFPTVFDIILLTKLIVPHVQWNVNELHPMLKFLRPFGEKARMRGEAEGI